MAGWLPLVKSSALLLDTLSASAVFAVSSRKLRAAYAGKALQIQSGTDISFDGSGNLDTSGLSGTNSIKIWYDQVGANNASNTTTGQQPIIQSSGTLVTQNGHVWAAGTSASALGSSLAQAQSYSVAILGKMDVVGVVNSFIGTQFAGNHLAIGSDTSSRWNLNAGGATLTASGADTNVHTFIYIVNSASSSIIVDGTTLATGNPGADTLAGFDLWDFINSAHIGEVIFFNGVLGAPDIAAIKANWVSYWGAPP